MKRRRGWRMAASLGLGGLLATTLLAGAAVCFTSGCSTLGYYAQSATGHLNLVQAARPVPEWLADPSTPPRLKARLELSQRIRDFAVAELGEPDNASYRRYADLKRGGEQVMTVGDTARCYPEHIHSVRNVGKDISMSLHTYRRHVNYTGRSEFDVEHKLEKPYVIRVVDDEYARA